MKKIFKFLPLLLVGAVSFGVTTTYNPSSFQQKYISSIKDSPIKNVIVFIGDGMGVNIVDAAGIYKGTPMCFDTDEWAYHAYVDTDSLSSAGFYLDETKSLLNPEENPTLYDSQKSPYDDSYIAGTTLNASTYTDSGAGGTAFATGKRTTNGFIGMDQFGNSLQNLTEIAHQLGKKTGVVSSDYLDGATPASFLGHVNSRHAKEDIYKSIAETTPADLILTAKGEVFTDEHEALFTKKGYTVANSLNDLDLNSEKILGKFSGVVPFDDPRDVPTLTDLTSFALDYLNNDEGFFLMVEGAKIDKRCHEHQTKLALKELLGFEESVKTAFEWAKGRDDTLILVTADHETGGLYYDKNAATQENIIDLIQWKTGNHSRTRVDLAVNIDISEFTSKFGHELRTLEGKPYWKNTDIFNLAASYFK